MIAHLNWGLLAVEFAFLLATKIYVIWHREE